MTAPTSRRAALGALLAAPLASVPAVAAAPAVTPELARLIAKHDRINAILNAEAEDCDGYGRGTIRAAALARARVAGFPPKGLPDILAKAACLARLFPIEDAEEETRTIVAEGWICIDQMTVALFVDLARYGEKQGCA